MIVPAVLPPKFDVKKAIDLCSEVIARTPHFLYDFTIANDFLECPICKIPVPYETRICKKCGIGIPMSATDEGENRTDIEFDEERSINCYIYEESLKKHKPDIQDSYQTEEGKINDFPGIKDIEQALWIGEETAPENYNCNELIDYCNWLGAYRLRGIAYVDTEQYDAAIKDFDEIIKLKGTLIEQLLSYYKSIKDFEGFSKVKNVILVNHAFDYIRRGITFSLINEYDQALADFEKATHLNEFCQLYTVSEEKDGSIYFRTFHLRDQFRLPQNPLNFDDVIDNYNNMIATKNGDAPYIYTCRGFCNECADLLAAAVKDYTRAIEENKKLAFVYVGRGNCNRRQRFYDEAIMDFNNAIAINSDNELSYIGRGLSYHGLREYGKATSDFKKALQINPDSKFVYKIFVYKINDYRLWIAGYRDKVKKHSNKIVNNPNNALSYIHRGIAYYKLGQFDESFYDQALDDLNKAVRLNPKSIMAYNYRGLVYIKKQQFDKAISDFDCANSIKPGYSLNGRGIAYFKMGEYAKAKEDFDKSRPLGAYDCYCRDVVYRKLGLGEWTHTNKYSSSEEESMEKDSEGRKEVDEKHYKFEVKSFSKNNKIRGQYLELTILGWERNKRMECTCGLYDDEICIIKTKALTVKPLPESLTCSVLKVIVKNISSQLMARGNYQLLDSEGNIHESDIFCNDLTPRGWRHYPGELYDGAQAKLFLAFPELDKNIDIKRFFCTNNRLMYNKILITFSSRWSNFI